MGVEVTSELLAKVPIDNLRVPLADFGSLWALAEQAAGRSDDDYLDGVVLTCRWLASQPMWLAALERRGMPLAPVTVEQHSAMPETIEEEYLVALRLAGRGGRPGLARGVAATLAWAWYRTQAPPLDIQQKAAG